MYHQGRQYGLSTILIIPCTLILPAIVHQGLAGCTTKKICSKPTPPEKYSNNSAHRTCPPNRLDSRRFCTKMHRLNENSPRKEAPRPAWLTYQDKTYGQISEGRTAFTYSSAYRPCSRNDHNISRPSS